MSSIIGVNKSIADQILTLSGGQVVIASCIYGIWGHETADGTSRLWRQSSNPGGIKYVKNFFVTSCFARDANNRDAAYPSAAAGLAALVFFLRQSRYVEAWGMSLERAISHIGDAGYVEHVPGEPANWKAGVTLRAFSALSYFRP